MVNNIDSYMIINNSIFLISEMLALRCTMILNLKTQKYFLILRKYLISSSWKMKAVNLVIF